jgi:hypothetical protein
MRSVTGNRTWASAAPRRKRSTARAKRFIARSIHMLDVIMLAIAFVFFVLSVGYAVACDRL